MRVLKVVTIAMAVMIVVGTAVLATLIAQRLSTRTNLPSATRLTLAQPEGTHIAAIAPLGPNLALLLQGGGPDRILVLDPHLHPTNTATLPKH